MHRHRFLEQLDSEPSPALPAAGLPAGGFMMCPAALWSGLVTPGCPWQQVYQMAYQQVRAVVAPSRLERLQPVSWN